MKAAKEITWKKIKTEYISSNVTFRSLGEKYGIPHSTIATRAKKENWQRSAEQISNDVEQKAIERITEKKVDEAVKMYRTADALMDSIIDCLAGIDMTSKQAPNAIKSLTSALKDLRDIKNLNKTELDLEEQKARIANLRKQAELEEQTNEITVSFEGVDEAWLK